MDCAKKLLEAKSWPDAQKILETSPSAGPATKQLVEWAFALKETQPAYAQSAMSAAVKEMEHDDEHKTKEQKGNDKSPDLPKNGSQEAPTHELNMEPNTQGDAEGSSSHADPLPKEGTKGQVTGLESATGENQMKEMPMPGMAPELQQGMMNAGMQNPPQPMPPGYPTMPQMKQMQYMIKENLKHFANNDKKLTQEITRLKSAIVGLDSKLKETQSMGGKSMELQIPPLMQKTKVVETNPFGSTSVIPAGALEPGKFSKMKTQETQARIGQINNQMNDDDSPYQ